MKLELDIQSPQNSSVNYDSANVNGFDNSSEEVKKLLRTGIKFAKDGSRIEARQMLLQVTEIDGNNETAWLWLASISEYPEELLVFLQNVLRINPENQRAIEWAKQTKSLLSKTFVQRGIDASHQNQKDFAKQCFLQAIVHDDRNEMAWLWLASSSDSPEEKCSHLQKVLQINPENETATSSLKAVKNQMSQSILKKANSAAISGDHEYAQQLLSEVFKYTPHLEEAWVLKAFLTNNYYEKISCYEKALEVNPDHDAAQAGLASLRSLAPKVAEPKVESAELEAVQEPVALETAEAVKNEEFQTESETEADEPVFQELAEETPIEQISGPDEEVEQSIELEVEPEVELEAKNEEAEVQAQIVEENQAVTEEHPSPALEDFYTETEAAQLVAESNEETPAEAEPQPVEFQAAASDHVEVEENLNQVESFIGETAELKPFAEEEKVFEDDEEEKVFEDDSTDTPETQFAESLPVAETVEVEDEVAETVQETPVAQFEEVQETQETQPVEDVQVEEDEVEENQFFAETANESPAEVEEQAPVYATPAYSENGFALLSANEPFADYQQPTVELSYSDLANFSQLNAEAKTADYTSELANDPLPTADYSAEIASEYTNGFHPEFQPAEVIQPQPVAEFAPQAEEVQAPQAVVETPAAPAELLQAEVSTQVFTLSQVQTQTEPVLCAFCNFENQPQSVICDGCQAMLSLSDLEMMLAHQNADQDLILRAIEKMEVEKTLRDLNVEELQNLGIAHLNVHNVRKGFRYLQEASQLNPNDVVLASKVNFLAIRLSEIEDYDQRLQGHPVQSRTILVVDDSPTVRKLISSKLEKSGHSVVSAVDGMDALAKINEVIPDLILLDITMPRLDGYQVCKLIRNNEVTKDIPIVMISGKDGFFDKVRGRMAGSSGYITKPFGPDTLMKTIETYLN